MKILHIFPGKVWGGAEQYVFDLGKEQAKRGNEVVFCCREGGVVAKRLKESGTPCEEIPFGSWFQNSQVRRLAALLSDVDVIHVHDASFLAVAVSAKRLSGRDVKIVLTRHIARRSRVPFWRRGGYRKLHKMIFVSDLASELWRSVNPWMPADRCVTVRNSVSSAYGEAVNDGSLRKKFSIDEATPIVMFTGRIRKSKGCEVIVRALGQLCDRDFALVFVGACKPSDYDAELKRIADESGIGQRVFFYGFSNDIPSLTAQSDLGVAPSIVREACPLSPMEFMRAGKTVIVTDNGAQKEYIKDGETGFIIPPADVDALKSVLSPLLPLRSGGATAEDVAESLVTSRALRDKIGSSAREYAEKHLSFDTFVDRILDAYR